MLDPRRPGGKYGPAKPILHPIHSNPPPARSVPSAHRRDRAGYENGVCLCFEHYTGVSYILAPARFSRVPRTRRPARREGATPAIFRFGVGTPLPCAG